MAVAGRQRRRVLGHGHLRRAVEDLEDPRARRDRPLGHAEEHAERPHGRDQHEHVGVEGGEGTEAERAVDHLAAADEQDRRQPEVGEEADQRLVEGLQPRRVHRLVEDPPHAVAKTAELALLAGEGLHHPHAGDVLLRLRRELGDALLDLLQRRTRPAPVAGGDEHDEGDGPQRDPREQGIEDEHRHGAEQQGQAGLQQEHQPVAQEEPHGLQVHRRARHELAGLLAVEERELQPLEVLVHALAQVVLDAERHATGDQPAGHRQDEAQEGRAGDRKGEGDERVAVVVARPNRIDRLAREIRDGDGEPDGAGREDQGGHDRAPIRTQKTEQPPEGPHYFRKYSWTASLDNLGGRPVQFRRRGTQG